jgi:hypothetical protein
MRTETALMFICILCVYGCAAPVQPPLPPITIKVPVAVACIKDHSALAAPNFPDTDAALKAAPNVFERVKLIVSGRLLRMAYEVKLEAALSGCE